MFHTSSHPLPPQSLQKNLHHFTLDPEIVTVFQPPPTRVVSFIIPNVSTNFILQHKISCCSFPPLPLRPLTPSSGYHFVKHIRGKGEGNRFVWKIQAFRVVQKSIPIGFDTRVPILSEGTRDTRPGIRYPKTFMELRFDISVKTSPTLSSSIRI